MIGRHIHRLIVTALILLSTCAVRAEIVVVVNSANPATVLTRKQVIDIYTGRQLNFPDGNAALPIDQALGSGIREEFYQALVNKSAAEVNAYWARLLFSGVASPPRALPTTDAVLKAVSENSSVITYMDSTEVVEPIEKGRVKIVFRLTDE